MIKKILFAVCTVCALLPGPAMAQKYRLLDKSRNNSCKFVHDWFLQVKHKHAVFVTTGGVAYGAPIPKGGICQAGGDDTLKSATRYAIAKCESIGKKQGNHMHCKIVESR
jgi:hypothetical protein